MEKGLKPNKYNRKNLESTVYMSENSLLFRRQGNAIWSLLNKLHQSNFAIALP